MEVTRAAKRAMWKIVRHASRPKADKEQAAVEAALIPLLATGEPNVRREFVWMLSEVGGNDSVAPLAALLADKDLREDARAALQRIPGRKSLTALKSALKTAPEDYRPAIAVSLRARGEKVKEYPSQKLVPTRPLD
jgi:HEAT repeat protein